MVYDPVRQRVVLFSGVAGGEPQETWEWNGKKWEMMRSQHRPTPARTAVQMSFDPIRKRVLLFGGLSYIKNPSNGTSKENILNDTWEWDGQDWKQLKPRTIPTKRYFGCMAADSVRKRIVMFGGARGIGGWRNLRGFLLKDTWEWNGYNWVEMKPKLVPRARKSPGLAYHARSGKIVLWGGSDSVGNAVDSKHVYNWDGKNWTQITPKITPPTNGGLMISDPFSPDVLHLAPYRGGGSSKKQDFLWKWNGLNWSKISLLPSWGGDRIAPFPPAKQVIAMGSWQLPKGKDNRHTWAWDNKQWKIVETRPFVNGADLKVVYFPEAERFLMRYQEGQQWNKKPVDFRWFTPEGLWEKARPKGPPEIAWAPMMAYHPKLKKILMWGGATYPVGTGKTWLFDGKQWSLFSSQKFQRPEGVRGITYDSAREVLLGLQYSGGLYAFDEKKGWIKINVAGPVPPGREYAFAYDPGRKVAVAYGGTRWDSKRSTTIYLTETWEWDGKKWARRTPKTTPPSLYRPFLKYHPDLGGVLLIGGSKTKFPEGANEDTWLYDGKDWKKLDVGSYASFRLHILPALVPMDIAYDSHRRRLLVCNKPWIGTGGVTQEYVEFRVKTLTTTQHLPRPGESLRFDVHLPSEAKKPFLFLFSGATHPGIPLLRNSRGEVEVLPLGPDSLFWFSLSGITVKTLDAQGQASIPFRIPNDKSLLWYRWYAAGVTLDPKTVFGRITNRVDLEIVK